MTYLTNIMANMANAKQGTKGSTICSTNEQDEIVIAGGSGKGYEVLASLESFIWLNKTWARREQMNQCHTLAT